MITYKIIESESQKRKLENDFCLFFESVYERALNKDIFEHQIVNSPYNDSPLLLAFDGAKIVGSALMIRQKGVIDNHNVDYYLFTTSAILKEYRSKGVYAELIKQQKEMARNKGVAFILAFPNERAYPVLKLFGGFKDITNEKLVHSKIENLDHTRLENSLVMDSEMVDWRFEHNSYFFYKLNDSIIVYKNYESCFDVLGIYKNSELNCELRSTPIPKNSDVFTMASNLHHVNNSNELGSLRAMGFLIDDSLSLKCIRINLLMSDVY